MEGLSKHEMHELDQHMIHQYHVPLEAMLEAIGRGLVNILAERYPEKRRVLVVVGMGNNGGGGLVAARLLAEKGYEVRLLLTEPEMFLKVIPKKKFSQIPDEMMVGIAEEASDDELQDLIAGSELIVDAMVGYNLDNEPKGEVKRIITMVNAQGAQVVAIDFPSGIDPDEGYIYEPTMRAEVTAAVALPKKGLLFEDSAEKIGDIYLLDIGVPDAWFKQAGVKRPPYSQKGFIKLANF